MRTTEPARRRRRATLGALAALAASTAPVPPAAAQPPAASAPLSVADAMSVRELADRVQVDLAPDGALVAYALADPRRAAALPLRPRPYFTASGVPRGHRGTSVWITDVRSGRTRDLSGADASAWSPAWSPDGRRLAFYADRGGATAVWLWDRERDVLRRLSTEPTRTFFGFEAIRWTPDGRHVVVKLFPEGMTEEAYERLLPAPDAAPAPGPHVPAGATARVYASRASAPPAAVGVTPAAPAHPAARVGVDTVPSFLNAELGDLALVDVETGAVRRIARRVRAMAWRVAPDGRRVAFSTRQPDGGTGTLVYDRYDLHLVDVDGGAPRVVEPAMVQEYGLGFSFSPDGRRLAWHSRGALHVRALDGDTATVRAARAGLDLGHEVRAPLWRDDATLLAVARDTLWRVDARTGGVTPAATPRPGWRLAELLLPADAERARGRAVHAVVVDPRSKRMGFQRLAVDGDVVAGAHGAPATVAHADDVAIGASPYRVDASADGRTVVFTAESAERPTELWAADGDLRRPRRLTELNPRVTGRPLGRARLVEWTGARGETLRGALLLPPDHAPGRRHPLVVKVYGGSMLSGTVNRFGLQGGTDNLQLLATRGYAVLLPDTPLREGTPVADLAAAVLGGVDAAIALGVVDSTRMAIMGHSYGGYSALAVAVQTGRFRAVVSSGGFASLLTHYGTLREDGSAIGVGWAERDQGRMGGHPWQHRDRYVANSPWFHLDRVTAPVLLLHGGADHTVPPREADETFVALRRLGKEATLVRYDGEGHHPGTWREANVEDYWTRILDWLARHLGGGPP